MDDSLRQIDDLIEGFEVATSAFSAWVIPVSCGILTGLFVVQRSGTAVEA